MKKIDSAQTDETKTGGSTKMAYKLTKPNAEDIEALLTGSFNSKGFQKCSFGLC